TKTLDVPLIGLYDHAYNEFSQIVESLKGAFENYFGKGTEFDENLQTKVLEISTGFEKDFVVIKDEIFAEG
ncbi:ligase, partial [Fervidobacterium sp. SC_NGM5_O18]